MKEVITLTKGSQIEVWGSLTEICRIKGYSYYYLRNKKYPFEYRGVKFDKIEYRKENGI